MAISQDESSSFPTEFRGCFWDDEWEFDAPCVIYSPSRYARFGIGSNISHLDYMIEDICFDIQAGRPHNDGDLDKECEWRGWGRKGFARRKKAEHVVVKVKWGEDGMAEIVSREVFVGPINTGGRGHAND